MTDVILRQLCAGGEVEGRHLIVTAHADDETISFGGALSRLASARVLQLTKGGGDDEAANRRQERTAAFAAAGWTWPVIEGHATDRQAHLELDRLRLLLAAAIQDADVIWAHPYEGGHLDHDTVAWLVQDACAGRDVRRLEFASYHSHAGRRSTFGAFWPDPDVEQVTVTLTGQLWARKQAALACYASQAHILRKFPKPEQEAYRVAPVYDFTQPPPPPYIRWDTRHYLPTAEAWRGVVAGASKALVETV